MLRQRLMLHRMYGRKSPAAWLQTQTLPLPAPPGPLDPNVALKPAQQRSTGSANSGSVTSQSRFFDAAGGTFEPHQTGQDSLGLFALQLAQFEARRAAVTRGDARWRVRRRDHQHHRLRLGDHERRSRPRRSPQSAKTRANNEWRQAPCRQTKSRITPLSAMSCPDSAPSPISFDGSSVTVHRPLGREQACADRQRHGPAGAGPPLLPSVETHVAMAAPALPPNGKSGSPGSGAGSHSILHRRRFPAAALDFSRSSELRGHGQVRNRARPLPACHRAVRPLEEGTASGARHSAVCLSSTPRARATPEP